MFGFERLELTDGTTTIDLLHAPYAITLSGLDLGIATLRAGTLGGSGPYTTCACTLPIDIFASCPSDVYAALGAVWSLLDQAQRWWKNEGVAPVYLVAQATGSTSAAVQAQVLRRADAEAAVVLPPVYEVSAVGYVMENVELRFVRFGQWLGASETSATSSAQETAFVMAPAFSGTVGTQPNPTRVVLDPVQTPFTYPDAYAIISNLTTNIGFVDTYTTGVSTAAASARSGAYYNFAGLAAGSVTSITHAAGALTGLNARRIAVIMSCRTPVSGTWQVQIQVNRSGGAVLSTLKTLGTGVTTPRLVLFESIAAESNTTITLTILVTNRNAGAADFDIDYLCVVATEGPFVTATAYREPTSFIIGTTGAGSSSDNLVVDPYVLNRGPSDGSRDRPYPLVYVGQSGPNTYVSWSGDAFVTTQGNAPVALLLAVDGANWRPMSGGSPVTMTASMTRRQGAVALP